MYKGKTFSTLHHRRWKKKRLIPVSFTDLGGAFGGLGQITGTGYRVYYIVTVPK